jgi:hypothetical protein
MSCCINNLGAFPHNKDLNTGINSAFTGQYKAILFFAGVRITRLFNGVIGSPLIIPKPFNEMYQYKMQIEQPDGSILVHNGCSDFVFKTYISMDLECPDYECIEEDFVYL